MNNLLYTEIKYDETNQKISIKTNTEKNDLDELLTYLIEDVLLGVKDEERITSIENNKLITDLMLIEHNTQENKENNTIRIEYNPATMKITTYHIMDRPTYLGLLTVTLGNLDELIKKC